MKGFWKSMHWAEWVFLAGLLVLLIALTMPNFKKFQCRAMQSQAKNQLARIYAAQKFYESEHGSFASFEALKAAGLVQSYDNWYHYFDAASPTDKKFSFFAKGLNKTTAAGDLWSIDQDKEITNLKNGCGLK